MGWRRPAKDDGLVARELEPGSRRFDVAIVDDGQRHDTRGQGASGELEPEYDVGKRRAHCDRGLAQGVGDSRSTQREGDDALAQCQRDRRRTQHQRDGRPANCRYDLRPARRRSRLRRRRGLTKRCGRLVKRCGRRAERRRRLAQRWRHSYRSPSRRRKRARMSHHSDRLRDQRRLPPADHSGRRRLAGTGARRALPRATTASTPELSKPDDEREIPNPRSDPRTTGVS